MSKYLVSTVETYRVENEKEATALIEEAKQNTDYILSKYATEHKQRTAKGEIVDEFYKVTLTKLFNDIKAPDSEIAVNYEVE